LVNAFTASIGCPSTISVSIDAAAWLRILAAGVLLLLIVEGEKALISRYRRAADRVA